MVEEVLLRHLGRQTGVNKQQTKCYRWTYELRGCSPRDPNVWHLVIPRDVLDRVKTEIDIW